MTGSITERRLDARSASKEAELTIEPTNAIGREARSFVVSTLTEWGLSALGDRAALAVSELATNALLHAHTGATVGIELLDDRALVWVRDGSVDPPRPVEAQPEDVSGRGLFLVAATTDLCGYELLGDGKRVWFALDRGGNAPAAPPTA